MDAANQEIKEKIYTSGAIPVFPHFLRVFFDPEVVGRTAAETVEAHFRVCPLKAQVAAGDLARLPLPELPSAIGSDPSSLVEHALYHYALHLYHDVKHWNVLSPGEFLKEAWAAVAAMKSLDPKISHPYGTALSLLAAFLQDFGKMALDLVLPTGYVLPQDALNADALMYLHLERKHLGVDHTLAGKWLGERWQLPEPIIAAMWLHHHPVGVLDKTPYPVHFVETVALAGLVAEYGNETEASPDVFLKRHERLIRRVGIPVEELRRSLSTSSKDAPLPDTAPTRTAENSLSPAATSHPSADYTTQPAGSGTPPDLSSTDFPVRLRWRLSTADTEEELLRSFLECLRDCLREETAHLEIWGEDGCVSWFAALEETGEVIVRRGDGQNSTAPQVPQQHEPVRRPPRRARVVITLSREQGLLGEFSLHLRDASARVHISLLQGLNEACDAFVKAWHRIETKHRMAQTIEALTAALWDAEIRHRQEMLESRLEHVARVAGGAAHLINNPLAAILGRAQLLRTKCTDPETGRGLDIIIDQARRISKIVNDLLQFSARSLPKMQRIELNGLLKHFFTSVEQKLHDQKIRLVEEYAAENVWVIGDRRQLEQVLYHVTQNAVQAMPNGGVLSVRLHTDAEGPQAVILISDTGQGIEPEYLEHVFEPFFTTKETEGATGLGLPLARGIIEAHGGKIVVYSTAGAGTTCRISLPIPSDLAKATETEWKAQPETKNIQAPLFLQVGTEAALAGMEVQSRGEGSFEILKTDDMLEAQAILYAQPIKGLIVDLDSQAEELKPFLRLVAEYHKSLPVFVIGQAAHREWVEGLLRHSPLYFLECPVEPGVLVQHLTRALVRNVA
jgi:signal transduction histidine kinase